MFKRGYFYTFKKKCDIFLVFILNFMRVRYLVLGYYLVLAQYLMLATYLIPSSHERRGTRDMGQGTWDKGTRDMGHGAWNTGHVTLDEVHWTWDIGQEIRGMGQGT